MRAIATVLLAAGVSATAQTPPVFRSEVASVHVDVFVDDRGTPVAGLKAGDFELKDNGVLQDVALVAAETRPVQATLVFDTSSSVAGPKLTALRAAGEAFLAGLRASDEAALMSFGEEVSRPVEPTRDRARVREALAELEPEGATAVFDALYAALALADPRGRSLVVLFTDGNDNSSILGERPLRTVAERSNAVVHVVGLREPALPAGAVPSGPNEQTRALREIAEASGGRYWTAESPGRLRDAFAAIAASLSQRYVLRYEPQGVARGGWHAVEVRLRNGKGKVQSRRGYWVAGGEGR